MNKTIALLLSVVLLTTKPYIIPIQMDCLSNRADVVVDKKVMDFVSAFISSAEIKDDPFVLWNTSTRINSVLPLYDLEDNVNALVNKNWTLIT